MFDVIYNTIIYLIFIGTGFALKKKSLLGENAVNVLMFLIMNFTLPCALLNGSAGVEMNSEMLLYIVMGFGVNIIMIIACLVVFHGRTAFRRGVYLLSCAGIDVGNFIFPFIITFYPGPGVIALSAFNIGNTMMNCGFNYVAASKVAAGSQMNAKELLKRLFTNVIFDTYILILILAVLHAELPERVTQITSVASNANIFLVMLMIGLKLEFHFSKEDRKDAGMILAVRLISGAVLAALIWLLPIDRIAKIVFTCTVFGPPASASNLFVKKLGYEGSITSQINVICIFTCMLIVTGLLMFFA